MKRGFLALAGAIFVLSLTGCISTQADLFIIKSMSPQEKAELLFQKGLAKYNDKLMEQNDLKAIPDVRDFFVNALKADPLHKRAAEYLAKTDSFKTLRFNGFMASAKKLKDKKGRTETDDYNLVIASQKAQDLDPMNGDVIKLKMDTADIRKQVIQKRVAKLAELEKKILGEKSQTTIAKLIPQATRLIAEIRTIDPGNGDAADTKKKIDTIVSSSAKKDIDDAKAKLAAKKYPEAEAAILRAEKVLSGSSNTSNPEIKSIKYQIYFKWSSNLYATKKYESADNRVAQAIAISRTPEALDLKNKIAKSASVKDYDAEINDMLSAVDDAIANDNLSDAMDMINSNTLKLKNQANKDAMNAKKGAITSQMKTIYDDAVAAYNDEDYEGARQGFRVIVSLNAGYEQAQAYLDRTNNKIRALEGGD